MRRKLFLLAMLFVNSALAQQKETEEKLSDVKTAIKSQQQTIKSTAKQTERLEKDIRQSDIEISRAAKLLRETRQEIKQTETDLAELEKKQRQLTTKRKQQESALSAQLRSAYSAGQYDYLKMLLNQKASAEVQRSLTYYQYLNRARTEQIDNFKSLIEEIRLLEIEEQQFLVQLSSLQQSQKENQDNLKIAQNQRKATLSQLKKNLSTERQQLDKLLAEEKNLRDTLARIQQQALELARKQKEAERRQQESQRREQVVGALNGLGHLKNKLNWPTRGRLSKRFGNTKYGSLRWKGVLMSAPIGRTVNTIYQGKVLFSDWLKGYGLVTVIDHGKGYMSLYGHNQTLLKQVGDIVETGEPIALVGQSGGQDNAGLYFEIRHNGKAVNPKLWRKS